MYLISLLLEYFTISYCIHYELNYAIKKNISLFKYLVSHQRKITLMYLEFYISRILLKLTMSANCE